MQDLPINYLAVIVAAIVKVAIAGVWFAIPVNNKAWMTATNSTKEDIKKRTPVALVVDLLSSFVLAWILAHAIGYAGAKDIGGGIMVGFFNWLGFILAAQIPTLTWDKRDPRFFTSAQIFMLIAFLVMGAILASWT
jgi:uncharacterized protein YebE (UPF0316 family)